MAIPENRRQRLLQRKAAKAKARNSQSQNRPGLFSTAKHMANAIRSPVHACYVNDYKSHGMAFVVLAKKMAGSQIAASYFLVDVYALGVKDAFFRVTSEQDYDDFLAQKMHELERIHPTCARKFVEGAVDYAAQFGFKPHSDYMFAKRIFGDIDKDVCPSTFEYGKNGKPLVITNLMRNFDDDTDEDDDTYEDDDTEPETIRVLEYEITEEPIDHEYMRDIPDSVVDEMNELYGLATAGIKEAAGKIIEFINKYPTLPQPHNYLYVSYMMSGDREKATETVVEGLKQFPNYLFGKISRAGLYIDSNEPHKIADIFQNNFELSYHCGGRTKVHLSEFVKFYTMVGRYYLAIGNTDAAKKYHSMLQSVVPDAPETRFLGRELYPSVISKWIKKLIAR